MIVGKLLEAKDDETLGYNAAAGKFENMVAAGIIDPVKVRAGGGDDYCQEASVKTRFGSVACVQQQPEGPAGLLLCTACFHFSTGKCK